MAEYVLITDGAYSSNRSQIGIGVVMLHNNKLILKVSKGYKNGTNNVAEILAIIVGLKSIKNPINSLLIVSDSKYALGTIFDGWQRNKNSKLLSLADSEIERLHSLDVEISWQHIRGHGKGEPNEWTKWNALADELAVKGSQELC